jgi:Protein of unknown function (DUF3551)
MAGVYLLKETILQERPMRSVLMLISTLVIVSTFQVLPSQAQRQPLEVTYPYCWNKSFFNTNNNCGFTSLAQCERYRAGGGGYCSENPRYQGAPVRVPAAGRKRY